MVLQSYCPKFKGLKGLVQCLILHPEGNVSESVSDSVSKPVSESVGQSVRKMGTYRDATKIFSYSSDSVIEQIYECRS